MAENLVQRLLPSDALRSSAPASSYWLFPSSSSLARSALFVRRLKSKDGFCPNAIGRESRKAFVTAFAACSSQAIAARPARGCYAVRIMDSVGYEAKYAGLKLNIASHEGGGYDVLISDSGGKELFGRHEPTEDLERVRHLAVVYAQRLLGGHTDPVTIAAHELLGSQDQDELKTPWETIE